MPLTIQEAIEKLESNYGSEWMNNLYAEWEKDNPKTIVDVDDWEDFVKYSLKDFQDEDLCEFYGRWIELRSNFYFVIKDNKFKIRAERMAYQDFHSIDLGGPEWACKTCGLILFDNFVETDALYGTLADFYKGNCSIECQKNETFTCVICQDDYQPFVAKQLAAKAGVLFRVGYSGICSVECLEIARENSSIDNRNKSYIRQISLRFEKYNSSAEIDSTVTQDAIYERDKGICYLCGNLTFKDYENRPANQRATLDHIIPLSKGGNHTFDNVKIACWRCNSIKGNR
jgi:5-methylcytosine-specific restriction endonuclease McrA